MCSWVVALEVVMTTVNLVSWQLSVIVTISFQVLIITILHHVTTLSIILTLCVGNPPITVESPHKGPNDAELWVFYASLNPPLNKQSSCRWFEVSWRSCIASLRWYCLGWWVIVQISKMWPWKTCRRNENARKTRLWTHKDLHMIDESYKCGCS